MAYQADSATGEIAERREAWMEPHANAMKCRDLEDHLRLGVGLFFVARLKDEAWSKKVQSGAIQFDPRRAREIHSEYVQWLGPCESALSYLEKMERDFPVEGAEIFRQCYRLARIITGIDPDALAESNQQILAGQSVPMTEEVWGGLPDNSHT